jgi:hypothetical protein
MILSPHHQNRIRNLGMSAVYRIAADEGVSVSDVLDLLVTAPFTPSQPGETSRSHAPAAVQDGEAVPPSSASPSNPIHPSPSPMANAPEPESRSTRSRQTGSGDFLETMK